jgi:hypothetical protein
MLGNMETSRCSDLFRSEEIFPQEKQISRRLDLAGSKNLNGREAGQLGRVGIATGAAVTLLPENASDTVRRTLDSCDQGAGVLCPPIAGGIKSTVGRYHYPMDGAPDRSSVERFRSVMLQKLSALVLESDLRCLSDWQRRHLPNIHSPLGQQILAWLIRNKDQPKPFNHLLISTSFSTTSVRHLLNQFAVLGLVEVRKGPVTRRPGDIVATPKLKERLEEYAERIRGIISHHRGLDSSQLVRTVQSMLLFK